MTPGYAGRLAPTPTGELHAGHAATFYTAWQRARSHNGRIFLRVEDIDAARCKPCYTKQLFEDLTWLGIDWDCQPVFQSTRRRHYLEAWRRLRDAGTIYPCRRSRREIATLAPHHDEPVFPLDWRGDTSESASFLSPHGVNWRFRVPDGEVISFEDGATGPTFRTAGRDFGDFLVWNRDDLPAYELAVVVDDLEMGITEIVRGEDLLTSTARQILVARALGATLPATFHCPLKCDASGRRLAKRDGAHSLRELRARGVPPEDIISPP